MVININGRFVAHTKRPRRGVQAHETRRGSRMGANFRPYRLAECQVLVADTLPRCLGGVDIEHEVCTIGIEDFVFEDRL